jgi:hypothetical protein
VLHARTDPAHAALFRAGLPLFRRAFSLEEGEIPVWLFRAGISTPLPARCRAPRLPLERVLRLAPRGR